MPKLTSEAVDSAVKSVIFKDDEIVDGTPTVPPIIVDGIMRKFGFHPDRVAAAKPVINGLLAELPDAFWLKGGGGMTFLNGCMDRHGDQWGEQSSVEALVCLGIAAGLASWILKDMASALPGGVPYFEVHPEPVPA